MLGRFAILLGMETGRRTTASGVKQPIREVTLSSNRQVGLASEFARAMRVKPKTKMIETLIRLPGGYGVLLMRAPRSYNAMLGEALAGASPDGVDATIKALREEWERPPR